MSEDMHESNNLPQDSKMKSLDQSRIKTASTLAEAALNGFTKEKFSYALIAFKEPIDGIVELAISSFGDSARIVEALRDAANRIEKGK